MKKVSIFFIFAVLITILFQTSCSIEKRHYRSGFYVDHNSHKKSKAIFDEKQNNPSIASITTNENNVSVKTEDNVQPIFHQSAEQQLISNGSPVFAHKTYVNNSTIKTEAKQIYKTTSVNALKQNAKALAFYAQSKKAKGGGDDQIVALLLCFFLGMLGIHSFYLGNKKKGIWQLVMFLVGILTSILIIGYVILTALGIWVLVDFIRLIIGDLGPGW